GDGPSCKIVEPKAAVGPGACFAMDDGIRDAFIEEGTTRHRADLDPLERLSFLADDRSFEPVARLEDEVELERRVRRAGPHASPYERRAPGSADSEVARGVVVVELEPVDAATIADRVDLAVGLIVREARALAVLPFDARAFDRTAFLIRDPTRDGASRCLDPPQRDAELARVGARIELRAHVGAHET